MGFFDLFKKRPPPPDIEHPKYGRLTYSVDEEDYECVFRGLRFGLDTPGDRVESALLQYMEDLANKIEVIKTAIEDAKAAMRTEAPPAMAEEIQSLVIDRINISNFKGKYNYCLISLTGKDPTGDMRAWRFELKNLEPVGLGFDS